MEEVETLKTQFKWARQAMMNSKETEQKDRFFDIMIEIAAEIENLEERIKTAESEKE